MRSLPLSLLLSATLAAALPAAAQTGPRRPPADTLRFGTTRPAAGDSIQMAEYDEYEAEDAEDAGVGGAEDGEPAMVEDSVPIRRTGPYARARGTGPFSVQASGETAPRPPRGEVVWLEGRAAARRDTSSARRDTASADGGQRVASGETSRRDTTSAGRRPAARDTAGARRSGGSASPAAGGRANAATGGRTGSGSSPSSSASGSAGRTNGNAPSAGARARSHTVASGETFYGIARRYGVTAAQLRAMNPDVEMDRLEVGDVLRLPAGARDSRAGSGSAAGSRGRTEAGTPPRQGARGQRRTHTVVAGETLFGIARRYGVTMDAIREANDMEGDQVRTGQRLVIPPAN